MAQGKRQTRKSKSKSITVRKYRDANTLADFPSVDRASNASECHHSPIGPRMFDSDAFGALAIPLIGPLSGFHLIHGKNCERASYPQPIVVYPGRQFIFRSMTRIHYWINAKMHLCFDRARDVLKRGNGKGRRGRILRASRSPSPSLGRGLAVDLSRRSL